LPIGQDFSRWNYGLYLATALPAGFVSGKRAMLMDEVVAARLKASAGFG